LQFSSQPSNKPPRFFQRVGRQERGRRPALGIQNVRTRCHGL